MSLCHPFTYHEEPLAVLKRLHEHPNTEANVLGGSGSDSHKAARSDRDVPSATAGGDVHMVLGIHDIGSH